MTYPSSTAAPERNQRDLLTLVTGAVASLVLIGTSLTALNKNVIGFDAWPGTSSEPTPRAVLPAPEPEASSARASFGFSGPTGASSLAIVGLPGAGLPGFRPALFGPGARGPGVGTRATIGEAPAEPPAPVVPGAPLPTRVTVTPVAATPVASGAVNAAPVPASISAPGAPTKADRKAQRKADRKAEKARDRVGKTSSQATVAAAPPATAVETVRGSVAAVQVATKGNGSAKAQWHRAPKAKSSSTPKQPGRSAPAVVPAPPAAVTTPAAGPPPVAAPQATGEEHAKAGKPDKGPKGGKGHGPS